MKRTIKIFGKVLGVRKIKAGSYQLSDSAGGQVGVAINRHDDWYAEAAIGDLYVNACADGLADVLFELESGQYRTLKSLPRLREQTKGYADRLRARLAAGYFK